MALITTLIPAYRPDYLPDVFRGLRRQSVRDFRVVVSDDSPDETITRRIRSGEWSALTEGLDIEVVRGPRNVRLNHHALIKRWNGSSAFVHIHLDDDAIFPNFYREHLAAHAQGGYSVSVSRRWLTPPDGVPAVAVDEPEFVAGSALRVVAVEAPRFVASVVPGCCNWLGEFSNMLLSAQAALEWPQPPAAGLSYYGWMDVGFLLTAVQQRPVAFIRDHLSIFRQHGGQTTHHLRHHCGRVSSLGWATYALHAWAQGTVTERQAVNGISVAVRRCMEIFDPADPVINRALDLVQHQGTSLARLHAAWVPFWQELLRSHDFTSPVQAGAAAPAP